MYPSEKTEQQSLTANKEMVTEPLVKKSIRSNLTQENHSIITTTKSKKVSPQKNTEQSNIIPLLQRFKAGDTTIDPIKLAGYIGRNKDEALIVNGSLEQFYDVAVLTFSDNGYPDIFSSYFPKRKKLFRTKPMISDEDFVVEVDDTDSIFPTFYLSSNDAAGLQIFSDGRYELLTKDILEATEKHDSLAEAEEYFSSIVATNSDIGGIYQIHCYYECQAFFNLDIGFNAEAEMERWEMLTEDSFLQQVKKNPNIENPSVFVGAMPSKNLVYVRLSHRQSK